jgi:hypothetical protein
MKPLNGGRLVTATSSMFSPRLASVPCLHELNIVLHEERAG